jgi:TatD family-associated radical SAM protein
MTGVNETDTYAYLMKGNLYINLTNRCTNACTFCLREHSDGVGGYRLWLEKEPSAQEVIAQMKNFDGYDEVVFCGYGEPMIRLDVLLEVAAYAKALGKRVRINTNGHANLYHGRDVAPELARKADCVSISLNAPDAAGYDALCHSQYGEQAFDAVLSFARACKAHVPDVVLSVVDILSPGQIEACAKLAEALGVRLRVRHFNA